jgi:outer membrane protein assembly factor BamB
MERINVKAMAGCILLAFISMSSFGQAYSKSNGDTCKMQTKLDRGKIPKAVTDAFYSQYPLAADGDWRAYLSFASGTKWYEFDPYHYADGDPDNYAIEFNIKDTAFRAIYALDGTKIASRKAMTWDMPAAVTDALNNGQYKSWTVNKDKEEIFKDSDSDKLKVYKVTVAKGSEKHTLYFRQDGKMLKDVKAA